MDDIMTPWNGNIFRVTGPLWGEFTGHRVNSPHKGQWLAALMFSFIWAWINGWINNREAGDLRHHCAHYDVTVMRTSDFCQNLCWTRLHAFSIISRPLQWRHNASDGVSNHRRLVCLLNCWGVDQRKHQSSAWLVDSPHKGSVARKMFAFDDVIMISLAE